MPLFLKALDPDIDVFGNRQSFHFNNEEIPDDNKGFYSLVNHFTPTASTNLESSLDLLDKNLNGFRLFHEQSLSQTYGSLSLQTHSVFGSSADIFKYDEANDKLTFYKDVDFAGGGGIISNTGKFDYISSVSGPAFVNFLSPIGMNNLPITDMASPSNNYDAANKLYVDSKIYNINSNTSGQLSISRLQNYPSSSSVYLRGDGSWTTPSANINLPYNLYTSATSNTDFRIYNSNNSSFLVFSYLSQSHRMSFDP